MWYEVIYSFGVTSAFMFGVVYMSAPFNYWDTGRWHRRWYSGIRTEQNTKRDHRLTGNMYVMSTLDSIPDVEEKAV